MAAAEEGDIRTLVGTLSSLASAPLIAADRPNSFPTRRSVRRRSTMRSLAGSEEGSDALSRPSVAPRERERQRERGRLLLLPPSLVPRGLHCRRCGRRRTLLTLEESAAERGRRENEFCSGGDGAFLFEVMVLLPCA